MDIFHFSSLHFSLCVWVGGGAEEGMKLNLAPMDYAVHRSSFTDQEKENVIQICKHKIYET